MVKKIVIALFLFSTSVNAQSNVKLFEDLGNLINDAIYFSDQYISPATDAVVYQAASSWVNTPKKPELWNFTLGLHFNTFFTPKSDRQFEIANNNFSFFHINGAETATTPTALGNKNTVILEGTLDDEPISLETPEGVNREVIVYPYLQGSLGLVYGTELLVRYSPRIYLKNVDYQVFGFGLKHNLSQYFHGMERRKVHLATSLIYSDEDVSVAFLDVQTKMGNLGLESLNSQIGTWQMQVNASKEIGKLELATALIVNRSEFDYKVDGTKGSIEEIVPLQDILNTKLEGISAIKLNYIGEVAGRYQFDKIFLQTSVAFGKFVNMNISVQYKL